MHTTYVNRGSGEPRIHDYQSRGCRKTLTSWAVINRSKHLKYARDGVFVYCAPRPAVGEVLRRSNSNGEHILETYNSRRSFSAILHGESRFGSIIAVPLVAVMTAWSAGLHGWISVAQASGVIELSDLVTSSMPGAASDHAIVFTLSNAIEEDETLTIEFETGFDLTAIGPADIDVTGASALTTAADCSGSENVGVSIAGQVITFEICDGNGGAIATTTEVSIEIGTHASGTNQILNPGTEGAYFVRLGGTAGVTGETLVAIVDTISVTATIETTFDFAVLGVGAATSTNGDPVLTSGTSTATSVPFGTLSAGVPKVLAQDLTVTTNAANGFAVTLHADGTLVASNGAEISPFVDGSATGTPSVWVAPSADSQDSATFGHWGITTEDESLSDGDPFGTALYVGDFVEGPREVFYHTGPADGETEHIGRTRVGFKIETSLLQEAATYETEVMYIATPLF